MRKNENAWREKAGKKSFPKSLIWLKLLNVYDILTNTISNQLHKIEIEFIKNVNLTGNEKLLPFICRHFDWKFVLLKIFCTKQGNVANIVEFFKCFWCKTKKKFNVCYENWTVFCCVNISYCCYIFTAAKSEKRLWEQRWEFIKYLKINNLFKEIYFTENKNVKQRNTR